ncbi:MAG: hypothetical protein AAGA09_08450 [Pseudomonadota bacterium]
MIQKFLAGVIGAGVLMGASPALAGEWKLDRRACPDLVEDRLDRREDRRDRRVTWSRRDAREDRRDARENRRDEAFTICPVSAFYYAPSPRELRGNRRALERKYRAGPPLRWDRRAGLAYRTVGGRRIYVRT